MRRSVENEYVLMGLKKYCKAYMKVNDSCIGKSHPDKPNCKLRFLRHTNIFGRQF